MFPFWRVGVLCSALRLPAWAPSGGMLTRKAWCSFLPEGLLVMRSDKQRANYDDPKHVWRSDRFLLLLALVLMAASYLFLR